MAHIYEIFSSNRGALKLVINGYIIDKNRNDFCIIGVVKN